MPHFAVSSVDLPNLACGCIVQLRCACTAGSCKLPAYAASLAGQHTQHHHAEFRSHNLLFVVLLMLQAPASFPLMQQRLQANTLKPTQSHVYTICCLSLP
jgi:hypothetical protein